MSNSNRAARFRARRRDAGLCLDCGVPVEADRRQRGRDVCRKCTRASNIQQRTRKGYGERNRRPCGVCFQLGHYRPTCDAAVRA
jgi:hypothetical protein